MLNLRWIVLLTIAVTTSTSVRGEWPSPSPTPTVKCPPLVTQAEFREGGLFGDAYTSLVSANEGQKTRAERIQQKLEFAVVTVIQRFGGSINLNPHLHMLWVASDITSSYKDRPYRRDALLTMR